MLLAMIFSLCISDDSTKVLDLKDGFVRVKTPKYEVEVPSGWEVGAQTSFGQREFSSKKDGQMSAMTGNAREQSWDQLYQTSLFFIKRSIKGTPTPFKVFKSKQGYEAISFSMVVDELPVARYVILKNDKKDILALSVKIPTKTARESLGAIFDRLVTTAKMF